MNKKTKYLILLLIVMTGCASNMKEQVKIATSTRSLAEAYMSQGKYTAALRELKNAKKIIPDDPFLQYDLGLVYMALEKYGLAEIHLKKAIDAKEDYTAAINSLGVLFMKQKKWDAAISLFQETADNLIYATPHYPLSNMGWAYLGKGDYMGAETSFKKALKVQPDFINAIHGLATIYITTGKSHRSRQLLDKAISKSPESPVLHADLARTLEMTGQYSAAKVSWKQVIRLAPDSGLADEARQRL